MNALQCKSCLGTYAPIQTDSSAYFHACSPVVNLVTGVNTPAPNTRDENVQVDAKGNVSIKSAGLGVQPVTIDGTGKITPIA